MRIQISGLSKKYGDTLAVRDVTLTVDKGEFVVLLGPSGCGKTTTLRSIAGLEDPTDGEIIIGPKTVYSRSTGVSIPPEGRDVGMVFQSYALWPHMTVFENVAFPLKSKRQANGLDVRKRVLETLALVGLEDLASRSASLLSGGQMQRVALARALVGQPAALLLDEPLSNLDLRLRYALRAELKKIQQSLGATSVYVTHDQTEAASLADRVVVMHNGRIAQQASPEELFDKPNSRFVAEFLGIPNIFSFRPLSVDGSGRYRGLLGEAIEVSITSSTPLDIGEKVDCWFRSDALEFAGGTVDEDAQISGEVLVRAFTGENYQYHVSLLSEEQPLEVVIELPLEQKFSPGDRIRVRFRPGQIRFIGSAQPVAA